MRKFLDFLFVGLLLVTTIAAQDLISFEIGLKLTHYAN